MPQKIYYCDSIPAEAILQNTLPLQELIPRSSRASGSETPWEKRKIRQLGAPLPPQKNTVLVFFGVPGKDPVPIVQEAGWAPGPVWTGGKSARPIKWVPEIKLANHIYLVPRLRTSGAVRLLPYTA